MNSKLMPHVQSGQPSARVWKMGVRSSRANIRTTPAGANRPPVFTLVFKAQRFADPLKSIGGETLTPYRQPP